MSLLGSAAMLLAFDVAPDAVAEHDEWHTHEHLPERLAIPGFLRGTRWIAVDAEPRYVVLYEVADLATLTSAAYLQRLNNPSAWTSRIMPHYRGMTRGLCSVVSSAGLGTGHMAYVGRFNPSGERGVAVRAWLVDELLPSLPEHPGIGSAHVLSGAAAAPMTREQRMRGADAGVDLALMVTGYDPEALAAGERNLFGAARLESRGCAVAAAGRYRLDYTLTHQELAGRGTDGAS